MTQEYDWSSVAKTYPLWVAQYPNYEHTAFKSEPWTDSSGFGAWASPLLFQYAGTGRIAGYAGDLDLDLFYGTKDDWRGRCAVAGASAVAAKEVKEVAINRANVAAQIMEHLVTCPEHGYSQPGRHGTSGYCSVQTDAGTVKVKKGDRDRSGAVCEAWELALAGTQYDGLITRYNWTGGMRETGSSATATSAGGAWAAITPSFSGGSMSCWRRRLAWLGEQVGWFLGIVACLFLMLILIPLVPLFVLCNEILRPSEEIR